ncbi:MAG: Asp-tRNA(Asn)/Glu-tRNA(Gln) amidotransferase subunit GatA [Candidatus Berkelbacteria bacterium]|nr:Asp-tRNA(Asn)/Glu-tRNA(Gln) amidotransferase subunit GatA [Candidatus Berkelbacteria bacterium]
MSNLCNLTIAEASKQLAEGKITSADLTKSVLERIEQVEPKVEAYLKVLEDSALKEAEASDKRRQAGKPLSKLDGVPIAVKDLFCTKDVETTAASNILKGFVPCYEATAVKKLKDAGVVLVGKLNQDAFAHGSSTENSDFKVTKNPWDLERVPGGSSGGSAAAVAADECLGALGTDTGGSIRQPASLCGVVGLKPTYGRVSRYGVIAMASSLDVIGPLAKTTEDAALIMEVIAGRDSLDGTTLGAPVPEYSKELEKDMKGLKVGVPKEYFAEGMDEDVKKVIEKSVEKLKSLGAEIAEISLPHTDMALATYYILQPAEVSSNLSRYDGIKYGFSTLREEKEQPLEKVYFESRGQGFGAEAKRRVMLGTHVLSAGYYDAYYKKAMKLRTLVKKDFDEAFKKVDVIVTPVSPTPAFKIGEKSDNPIQMYLSDIYTVPINPAGVPAISTPAGFVERDGKKLPVGIQIIGPMLGEPVILNVSYQLEKALSLKDRPKL